MKPECELCKPVPSQEGISRIFGMDVTEKLLYNLFNRKIEHGSGEGKFDLNKLVQQHLDSLMGQRSAAAEDKQELYSWAHSREAGWLQEYSRMKEAREKAWKDIIDRIKRGELQPSDLHVDQIMQNFMSMVIEGLTSEGLIDLKLYRHWMYPNIYIAHPEFTEKSEKIIAKKVLEEAFANLRKLSFGPHEVRESGHGQAPSSILSEYDEFQHTYDMVDVQETLITTAIRDPKTLQIKDSDVKARIPLHKSKSANVILIDASYSMRGDKFRGGVMAALAFKELLQQEYKDDTLYLVAYNQKPQLLNPGQIIKLRPYGYTDIGQALDLSIELLGREEGNKNVFLITDGEPTASMYKDQTPEESTLRAAYMAGKQEIKLNIIMLDRRPELRRICERMAKLNGNAILAYVENPLNLKEFVIKTFIDYKKMQVS